MGIAPGAVTFATIVLLSTWNVTFETCDEPMSTPMPLPVKVLFWTTKLLVASSDVTVAAPLFTPIRPVSFACTCTATALMPMNVEPEITPFGSTELPRITRRMPSLPRAVASVPLIVVPVIENDAMLVLKLSISTPLCDAPVIESLVNATAPLTLVSSTPSSSPPPLAVSVTLQRFSVKPLMVAPLIPSVALFAIFIYPKLIGPVVVSETPTPVVFWIVPPEPLLLAPPSPVTVSPPAPVVLKMMPLAGSAAAVLFPAEMLRNVIPEPPMVALTTLSAAPVVELRLLFVPVAVAVPLVVRLSAVPPVTVTSKSASVSVPTALPVMPEPFELVTFKPCRLLPLPRVTPVPLATPMVGRVPPVAGKARLPAGGVRPVIVARLDSAPCPMSR